MHKYSSLLVEPGYKSISPNNDYNPSHQSMDLKWELTNIPSVHNIRSYYVQYSHILDVKRSYIKGRREYRWEYSKKYPSTSDIIHRKTNETFFINMHLLKLLHQNPARASTQNNRKDGKDYLICVMTPRGKETFLQEGYSTPKCSKVRRILYKYGEFFSPKMHVLFYLIVYTWKHNHAKPECTYNSNKG